MVAESTSPLVGDSTKMRFVVLPMTQVLEAKISEIKNPGHRKDPWGRPLSVGDLNIVSGVDHSIGLGRKQFEAWFEHLGDGRFRPRPISSAIMFNPATSLHRVGPAAPFSLLASGEAMLMGITEDAHALLSEQTLMCCYYLHDKRHSGPLLLPRSQFKNYFFPTCTGGIPGESPSDGPTESCRVRIYLGQSREEFNARRLTSGNGKKTLFGDPAINGDFELSSATGDTTPFIAPQGLYQKWFKTSIKKSGVTVSMTGECHIFQPSHDFVLETPGKMTTGLPGDCIVSSYDPRGIINPCVMSTAEVLSKYEVSGGLLA